MLLACSKKHAACSLKELDFAGNDAGCGSDGSPVALAVAA